jgi:hypothetical protein
MTIADARENYYFFSGKLSDVVRQLNFAGIAIFWIFRAGDKNGGIPYSDFLLWPLGLMIASLAADMLHYALATLMWGPYGRYKEQRVSSDEEFQAPRWLNWPALCCIIIKTILCAAGYCLLLKYVAAYLAGAPSLHHNVI